MSLNAHRDRPILSAEACLFWIELAIMTLISIRFVRGAAKLRLYMGLKKVESGEEKDHDRQSEVQ